ncbi:hypothetical protein, partial [Stenotrophomonas sp. SMYL11]|uniref:hypothetical protein n=1 Tax=Stenotrophomonas sp. SMYL11 TaxID=3076042 RepID=UPI002E78734B
MDAHYGAAGFADGGVMPRAHELVVPAAGRQICLNHADVEGAGQRPALPGGGRRAALQQGTVAAP